MNEWKGSPNTTLMVPSQELNQYGTGKSDRTGTEQDVQRVGSRFAEREEEVRINWLIEERERAHQNGTCIYSFQGKELLRSDIYK